MKKAKKGQIIKDEIRQVTVDAMVDTGATTLIINKELFQKLGLEVHEEEEITFANDSKEMCKLTEPVGIYYNGRNTIMPALVVENASEILLGVLPLEGMDLMVDTVNHKLVGAHGDKKIYRAK